MEVRWKRKYPNVKMPQNNTEKKIKAKNNGDDEFSNTVLRTNTNFEKEYKSKERLHARVKHQQRYHLWQSTTLWEKKLY